MHKYRLFGYRKQVPLYAPLTLLLTAVGKVWTTARLITDRAFSCPGQYAWRAIHWRSSAISTYRRWKRNSTLPTNRIPRLSIRRAYGVSQVYRGAELTTASSPVCRRTRWAWAGHRRGGVFYVIRSTAFCRQNTGIRPNEVIFQRCFEPQATAVTLFSHLALKQISAKLCALPTVCLPGLPK